MNRKEFIKNLGILTAGVTLPSIPSWGADNERLVILHTNDWHSHIESFSMNHKKYPGMGGASKRASYIQEIKSKYKHVLVLDSGDIFQGTPYFNFFGGELEFKLMSAMGYDFATLGNHDFDLGIDALSHQLKNAKFKFLNSNYNFQNTPLKNKIENYAIVKKGNFKIGILGVGIELNGLVPKNLYGNIKYEEPIKKANQVAKYLKSEGCNIVICLSHLGFKYNSDKVSDVKLAQNSTHIDLILGGHTHTFMNNPREFANKKGKNVLINQTGWAGIFMGRIDYEINNSEGLSLLNNSYKKIS